MRFGGRQTLGSGALGPSKRAHRVPGSNDYSTSWLPMRHLQAANVKPTNHVGTRTVLCLYELNCLCPGNYEYGVTCCRCTYTAWLCITVELVKAMWVRGMLSSVLAAAGGLRLWRKRASAIGG
eukprot:XP_001699865.1 predicted protein [Chlamydomonas reinhardtii]